MPGVRVQELAACSLLLDRRSQAQEHSTPQGALLPSLLAAPPQRTFSSVRVRSRVTGTGETRLPRAASTCAAAALSGPLLRASSGASLLTAAPSGLCVSTGRVPSADACGGAAPGACAGAAGGPAGCVGADCTAADSPASRRRCARALSRLRACSAAMSRATCAARSAARCRRRSASRLRFKKLSCACAGGGHAVSTDVPAAASSSSRKSAARSTQRGCCASVDERFVSMH